MGRDTLMGLFTSYDEKFRQMEEQRELFEEEEVEEEDVGEVYENLEALTELEYQMNKEENDESN